MTPIAKTDKLQIDRLELGPFGTNAYLLTCQATKASVLFDAPGEPKSILRKLKGTNPLFILMTHDHIDHVGALAELKSALNIPVAVHADDARGLRVPADRLLNDGEKISVGSLQLQVLHTPGHTPGSLCYLTDHYLLAGDTIFPGGPGKTGSPDALRQIIQSITTKIFKLPDDTLLLPGHGEFTTVGEAKKEYAVFAGRPHDPNLCGDVLWQSS